MTTESDRNSGKDDVSISPWITVQLTDVDKLQGQELKFRIEELLRIKQSVSIELRDLEAKRQHLQLELTSLNRKLEDFKSELSRKRNELDRLQMSVQQAKVAEKEAMERNTPRLGRPKPLHPLRFIPTVHESLNGRNMDCNMDSCFDYSLCPIASKFTFYLYRLNVFGESEHLERNTESLHRLLSTSVYAVRDNNPLRACLFFLLLRDCSDDSLSKLNSLPNWFGDGRNHVIWLQCHGEEESEGEYFLTEESMAAFGRAMLIQESINNPRTFRDNFDVVASNWNKPVLTGEVWSQLPPIVPAKRKYLSTYLGGETEPLLQSDLLKIQQADPTSFVFQFSCRNKVQGRLQPKGQDSAHISEEIQKNAKNFETYAKKKLSTLCGNDLLRTRLLLDSTFTLILLPPDNLELRSSYDLQLRLYEALKFGSIPVVLGSRFLFPFNEVIDWSRIAITFPIARISELHYLLKSFTDSDILAFKKSGRLAFENYLSTLDRLVSTVLATFRVRIGLPPLPYEEIHWHSAFNESVKVNYKLYKLESFSFQVHFL